MSRGFPSPRARVLCAAAGWLLAAASALPAQPILSGNLDVAYKHDIAQEPGEADSDINKSLKGLSAFNLVRARFFVDAELADDITVLTTTIFDSGFGHFDLEGAYLLFHGVAGRESVNLQVGRMQTVFGRFPARALATDNPLIGTPLIYHYFSAVRGDRAPSGPDQQLAWRTTENAAYQVRGLPTLYETCWNTGIQLFGATRHVAWALAATKGAVSNPGAKDNDGAQLVGRLGVQPAMGLQLGLSAAWGPYLEARAAESLPPGAAVEDYAQTLVGFDGAWAAGHLEVTWEVVHNRWEVANLAGDDELRLTGGYLEAVLALRPGLHWATRVGHMGYGDIDDGSGRRVAWDWDVSRLETGFEHYLERNVRLKGVVQLNHRPDAPDDADHMVGVQLASSF